MELSVHTKEATPCVFVRGKEMEAAQGTLKMTPLLAYFKLNSECTNPEELELLRTLKFVNVPEHYTFNRNQKKWTKKGKSCKMTIGSLYPVSPKNRETFFLRALMQKKPFPLSYEDVRTVDGVTYDTYREAAVALGLVQGDEEYRRYV